MYSSTYIWAKVLGHMEQQLTPAVVSTWFDDTEVLELTDQKLVLFSPSTFRKDMIVSRCAVYIQEALKDLFDMELELIVLDETQIDAYRSRKKKPRFIEFNPQFTFDNFIVGNSNRFANAAAVAVAEKPADSYNPLFIYGPSGVGKTHLLYAIANEIHKAHPDYNIVYIKGDQFTNELINALREGKNNEFRLKYRGADLFLVDDIQFIAGKDSTQEEFFHTFNNLYESHKQIVLTSDRPPKEIKTLEERLRTRFEWGLIADIQPPDFETRIAIIKRKAELLDLEIPSIVEEYIANHVKNNIRQLEGVVKKLNAYNKLAQTPPSILLAQSAIREILTDNQPIPVTVERIISEVGRTFGVSPEDIRSSKRSSQISNARQIAMYVIREITQMSMAAIGNEFGGRDHSTVVYATSQVVKNMKQDTKYKETVEDIIKNIRDS